MTNERLKDFVDYANISRGFEFCIYHLRLDPVECKEAAVQFRALADQIDAGTTRGGYDKK